MERSWERRLAVSSLLALATFVVYAALPQRAFHGFDTDYYAALLQAGALEQVTTHVAYLPVCAAVYAVLRPFGAGPVDAMLVASAMGSAVGAWFLHRAGLRLVQDRSAAWLPIAVAVTPGCFYFATAAEVHGVFAAASGAAWFVFARWRDAPSLRGAALLGLAGAVAASVHTLGHLLSPMFVAIAGVQRVVGGRELLRTAGAVAAAHGAAAVVLLWLVGRGASAHGGDAVAMLVTWSHSAQPSLVGDVLWRECLAPFLPWSALALAALFVPRARPWALAWLVGLALHAVPAALLLARPGGNYDERGAYLLPIAVPAVLAAGSVLPRRWGGLAVLAAAALALRTAAPHWQARYDDAFVAAVARLQVERGDLVWIVGPGEIEGVRAHAPGLVAAEIERSLAAFYGMDANGRPPLPAWFDAMVRTLGVPPRTCVLTAEARAWLERSQLPEVRTLWREHVPATYGLEPLQAAGLDALLLRPR